MAIATAAIQATEPLLTGMRLLIVAATFPNRLQPWLINSTAQALRHGADVYIAAATEIAPPHHRDVETFKLMDRTIFFESHGVGPLRTMIANLTHPRPVFRQAARSGMARLPTMWQSDRDIGLREFLRRCALVVPLGLNGLSLIHAHSLSLAWSFLSIAKTHKIPFVYTFHGLRPEGTPDLREERQLDVYREAASVLVNTEWARQQVVSLGCPKEKTKVLPQGIEIDDFVFSPQQIHPGETLRLLSVGRLHKHKGYSYTLQAIAWLVQENVDVEYRIVGSGPHKAELMAEAESLGIGQHVHFLGEQVGEGLWKHYQWAHVFVLASVAERNGWVETQGVSIQEAQASGKLVVATRSGGIPECVDDGDGAFLVDERDAAGIRDVIRFILANTNRWPAWQSAARKWVTDNYSVDSIGRRLALHYCDVVRG